MLAQTEQEKKVAWYNLVGQFKQRAREFMAVWNTLQSKASDVSRFPALQKEYADLNRRAGFIKTSITKITNTVDSIMGWFRSVFGLSGVESLEGLGILPLLPIAIIAGALTLIGKWISDVYIFNKKLEEQKRLEPLVGVTQASRIVQRTGPQGMFASFGRNIMPVLLIGGALLLFGPMLFKQFKKPSD